MSGSAAAVQTKPAFRKIERLPRATLMAEPPSTDGNKVTDKGYINQRAVLTRRALAVATLDDDTSAEWIGCTG